MAVWNFLQNDFFSSRVSKVLRHFLILLLIFITFVVSDSAYADITSGIGRKRECNASGKPDGLDYSVTNGGKDLQFVMSNPVCATLALTLYANTKMALSKMNAVCATGSGLRITPSPIMDLVDISKASKKALSNQECFKATVGATGSLFVFLGALGVVYAVAKTAYEETEICGHEWYQANTAKYVMTSPNYKQQLQDKIREYIKDENSARRLENLSLSNKTYREFYYGGVEFEDEPKDMYNVGPETCRDPSISGRGLDVNSKYEDFPPQKYYLRGLEAGNYNCKRYKLMSDGQDDPLAPPGTPLSNYRKGLYQKAFECCKDRSQNFICIRRAGHSGATDETRTDYDNHVFCKAGKKCTLRTITYETKSIDNNTLICANSYSVCPYNFAVSGGAEYCDFYKDASWDSNRKRWIPITSDIISTGNCAGKSEIRDNDCSVNKKAGRCRNYCQYLTHCTQTSAPDFPYNTSITSPYFSSACINFTGDSLNQTSYNTGFVMGSQRHFSTPIAQCVKETLENIFHNKAGHSLCKNKDDIPSSTGVCSSGNYEYRKNYEVQKKSFFQKIQDTLHTAIKIALVMAITFYGFNILIGKSDIRQKKDILMFLIKIGFVMYFAAGDAWQSTFFNGLYGASTEFSRMVFKISSEADENKNDGCQFGILTKSNGTEISSGRIYPQGKEYLALWDTLDCKIARYLGFGPEASVANLASLIFAGMFSSIVATAAIYMDVALMFFGFFMLALTIRALHIFLSSVIAIILMVFVSPIIIPTVLFKKTENIFKGWLTNLISFCLQPMFLFAYIAIMIMVFDKTMIGSATFYGEGPMRSMSCSEYCKSADGAISEITDANKCEGEGQNIVNPMDDSVACLINVDSFNKFPGLEVIGLSIPILDNILSSNVKERILTLLKGALVMYLLYKFADEIPGITSAIIGGAALPKSDSNAMKMMRKVAGAAKNIQKRGSRAAGKAVEKYKDKIEKGTEKAGNQGKSVEDVKESSGENTTGSGGGGANETS